MVKAGAHLAAGAIAAALLLTGAGGAVAVADTPADSTASENSNSTAPDSSAAPAEHSVKAEHPVDNNTFSSSENARSAGDQADNAVRATAATRRTPLERSPVTSRSTRRSPTRRSPTTIPARATTPAARRSIECRYFPKLRLPSTWPRCPKRRLRRPGPAARCAAPTPLPAAPSTCPRNATARRYTPHHSGHARRPRHGGCGCRRSRTPSRRE